MLQKFPLLVSLLAFLFVHDSNAQVTLFSSPYTQDFNSIGSGLPTGWTVRTGATSTVLGTEATLVTTATSWSSTSGNFRNVASANGLTSAATTTVQSNSTDRALAIRQTGSVGDPGAGFVLELANTVGLGNFSLSFSLQSLLGTSSTGRTSTWEVDYGFGSSPTSFSSVVTNPASLTTVLPLFASTSVTVDFGTALDNINDFVWIRVVTLSATTGSGSRPTSGIDDVSLSFIQGDITPPIFTSNYPNVSGFTASGFSLYTNLNEAGRTYYVVLADGASAPTAVQVKNGQDASGALVAAGYSGSIDASIASTEYSTVISGLNDATDYDVYIVAEDAIPNLQTSPVEIDIRTNAAGDVTPPAFLPPYPIVDTVTPTTFILRTSLNELGKTYFVVLTSGSSTPTADQVKLGQDAAGNTLSGNLTGTINITSANTEFTTQVIGLTASTNYDIYCVAEDNVPILQPAPTKISILTGPLFKEDFETCEGNSFTSYSVTGASVWGCVDFGYNGTNGYRMNGFVTSSVENEDWLISPILTLQSNAALSFYSQFSFDGNSLQLKISTDYTGSGDPNLATWTGLNGNFPTVAVGSSSTSNSDWTISNVDLSTYTGQAYIAFIYTSTSTAASRWSLDNISVSNATASYLQVSPTGLSFSANNISINYAVKGVNLQDDLLITAPTNFLVSKDNNAFTSSISYASSEVNDQQNVYVKFSAPAITTETFTGIVVNSSSGVSSKNVKVTGTDKSQTFNIATHNLEFFGTDVKDATGTEFGPTDDALQVSNESTVMQTIAADVFAVEEISDDNAFNQLVSNLPGYDKVVSDRWSYSWQAPDPNYPPQKTGFIYNTSRVTLVSTRVMFAQLYDQIVAGTVTLPDYPTGTSSSLWSSGRLPFMATFDVTINGIKKRIRMVDVHGKSASDQSSYDRRVYDANMLRDSLNTYYKDDNIILLGDFNDQVYGSINTGLQSSYKSFVDDTDDFDVITYALNQSGASTFPSSTSFIDNIIISNELANAYVDNSVAVEDPRNYISNYSSTTSDHLPVSARFLLSTKANQAITFNALKAKTFGDASFTLNATSSSGLAVIYATSDATIASISENTVTILKAGTVTITASQAGDSNFNAATNVDQPLTIEKANQAITFNTLTTKTYGDASFTLDATSSSGLTVSYASSDATIAAISGNTVTILKAGTVTITASQAGGNNFNAATNVAQPLTIEKANQAITFNTLTTKTYGDAAFTLDATSSSGLTVSYTSSDATIVSISENTVTILKVGTVTITASQAGDSNFNAATNVDQPLTIEKANQAITFNTFTTKTYGDAVFTLDATSSSGLAVIYASSDTTIVAISENTVTILKTGTVTITASQAGGNNFNAATNVAQPLTIEKANQAITFNTLTTKTYGDAAFTLDATSSSGLAVSYASSDATIAWISENTVTILKAGTVAITASQAGSNNFNAATNVDQSLTINKANQTITFGALSSKTEGDAAFTLNGSASSGLTVSYSSSDPTVASVDGNTITVLEAGTATITASQVGSINFNAAGDVPQSLTINESAVTGIETVKIIACYPNPVESYIFVTGLTDDVRELQVFDVTGRSFTFLVERMDSLTHSANVKELPPGFFIMRMNQRGVAHSFKFIKK